MATGQAHAKIDPCIPGFYAILADADIFGVNFPYLGPVSAGVIIRHKRILTFPPDSCYELGVFARILVQKNTMRMMFFCLWMTVILSGPVIHRLPKGIDGAGSSARFSVEMRDVIHSIK